MKTFLKTIIIIVLVISLFILSIKMADKKNEVIHLDFTGEIREIDWSMTIENIKTIEKKEPDKTTSSEDYQYLIYENSYLTKNKYKGTIQYLFTKDEKLASIQFIFDNETDCKKYKKHIESKFSKRNEENDETVLWLGYIGEEETALSISLEKRTAGLDNLKQFRNSHLTEETDLNGVIKNFKWSMTKKDIRDLEHNKTATYTDTELLDIMIFENIYANNYRGNIEYSFNKNNKLTYVKFYFSNSDDYNKYIKAFKEEHPEGTKQEANAYMWIGIFDEEYSYMIANDLECTITLINHSNFIGTGTTR